MERQLPLWSQRWTWVIGLLLALLPWPAVSLHAEMRDASLGGAQRLSVGDGYACAIDGHARLNCWGRSASQFGAPPEGHFVSVALGEATNCAVRSDGEAVCWSRSPDALATPPPGPWRSLAVGWREACGLRPDGRLQCWGEESDVAASATVSGRYISVSISLLNGCAIRIDGTLQCWSKNTPGYLDNPPPGRFLHVRVSEYHACALRADGRVLCWGPGLYGSNDAPEGDGFVDVSVGYSHGCALHEHGRVVCWGGQWTEAGTAVVAPEGEFTEIASSFAYNCGRKADGTAQCWDADPYDGWPRSANGPMLSSVAVGGGEACALDTDGEAHCAGNIPSMQPPPGRYSQLSLGSTSGCGLLHDGSATCWGASLGPTPAGAMSKISVGGAHACGIQVDGAMVCWGDDSFGQIDAPQGVYLAVVAGDRYSCAITVAETISCWGQDDLVSGVPVGAGFRTLVVSDKVVCASREFGPSLCWGDGATWLWRIEQIWYPVAAVGDSFACWIVNQNAFCEGDATHEVPGFSADNFIAIAAAGDRACAIDTNRLVCGGSERSEQHFDTMRIGTGSVSAGRTHTCNADSGGLIDCWGGNAVGQRESPQIRARALDASADHACATGAWNMLRCWGDDSRGGNLPPPGLATRSVDLGQYNGCAVRSDGSPFCWGWNVNGQSTPPGGAFRSIATGLNHSCGLRDDSTLACWGYGADGQTDAPAGEFLTVDVGERHSCAIAVDGELQCWGMNGEGQANPHDPAGTTYRALSTGSFHNCAIRSDGTLMCWGRNDQGQSTPPQGRFASVSAGVTHSCAVRDDGARICWGSNASGQAPTVALGPDDLPRGDRDVPYESRLLMTGSAGYEPRSPKFRLVSGTLPPWVELDESGFLRGLPQSVGGFDFVVEARDANGFIASRAYRLQIGPSLDATPPQIDVSITGPLGDNGWFNGDVHIRWVYDDPESGIVDVYGCDNIVVTEDFSLGTIGCVVTNRGGGTHSESRQFKRDATPPEIREYRYPAPNAEGWSKAPVTVGYDCWDLTSGLASACPQGGIAYGEGVQTFQVQSVRDNAGNIAYTPTTPVKIDWTSPQLSATMPPAQLTVGATHDFHLSATDALSGIASQGCTPINTSTPSASDPTGPRVATCTAIDHAGNIASLSAAYEVVPSLRRISGSSPQSRRTQQSVHRNLKPAKPGAR